MGSGLTIGLFDSRPLPLRAPLLHAFDLFSRKGTGVVLYQSSESELSDVFDELINPFHLMARPEGLEPPITRFEVTATNLEHLPQQSLATLATLAKPN